MSRNLNVAARDAQPACLETGLESRSAAARADRFLPFAFAGADHLLEVLPDGRIGFALGAFGPRFGAEAQAFLGRDAACLFAPQDQASFALAVAAARLRGRMQPVLLRLADARFTLASVAALLTPGEPPRLCITIGPVPAGAATPPSLVDSSVLLGAARHSLDPSRNGTAQLALVEVAGWGEAKRTLTDERRQLLRQSLGAALVESETGSVASEIADGRFSVIVQTAQDLGAIVERLQQLIQQSPVAGVASVERTAVPLDPCGLSAAQATRALRFALSRFASGGIRSVGDAGAKEGLGGIIARAGVRVQAANLAINEGRFKLQFQPVVDLSSQGVHHYEALLRPIATPALPATSTEEFVTFAEAVGLSEALDLAVLNETLRLLDSASGPIVAVNVSGQSIQSVSFRDKCLSTIATSGHAARVMVELTETAEIDDIGAAVITITRLRDAGVEVCIDDFGAGAAAFRYLRDLPVDYVKIDGRFVGAAPRAARDRSFVVAMVELARSVGARTVAEMVETEEQRTLMTELGVELGQGWLFGRPGALPGSRL